MKRLGDPSACSVVLSCLEVACDAKDDTLRSPGSTILLFVSYAVTRDRSPRSRGNVSKEIWARTRKNATLQRPMQYARNTIDLTPREREMKAEKHLRRAGGCIRLIRPTATTHFRGK